MVHKIVNIDSVRYAQINGKWVILLKRIDAEEYFPIYVSAGEANVVKKELVPSRFRDLKGYERFLVGEDMVGFNLESLIIDEIDGYVCAKLFFRKGDNTVQKTRCPVAGAIALAFRRRARIFVDESSFYYTMPTKTSLAS